MAVSTGKPPRKNRKGQAPQASTPPNGMENTSKSGNGAQKPIHFLVGEDYKKEWKMYCAEHSISQVDMFKKMFSDWKERHGG